MSCFLTCEMGCSRFSVWVVTITLSGFVTCESTHVCHVHLQYDYHRMHSATVCKWGVPTCKSGGWNPICTWESFFWPAIITKMSHASESHIVTDWTHFECMHWVDCWIDWPWHNNPTINLCCRPPPSCCTIIVFHPLVLHHPPIALIRCVCCPPLSSLCIVRRPCCCSCLLCQSEGTCCTAGGSGGGGRFLLAAYPPLLSGQPPSVSHAMALLPPPSSCPPPPLPALSLPSNACSCRRQ